MCTFCYVNSRPGCAILRSAPWCAQFVDRLITGARPPDDGSASPSAWAASVSGDRDRCSISPRLLMSPPTDRPGFVHAHGDDEPGGGGEGGHHPHRGQDAER